MTNVVRFRSEGGTGDILRSMCVVKNIYPNDIVEVHIDGYKGTTLISSIPKMFNNVSIASYNRKKERYYVHVENKFKKPVFVNPDFLQPVDGVPDDFIFTSFDWSLRHKTDLPVTKPINVMRHFTIEQEKEIITKVSNEYGLPIVTCDNKNYSLGQILWLAGRSKLNIVCDSFIGILVMCVNKSTCEKSYVAYNNYEGQIPAFLINQSGPFYNNGGAHTIFDVNSKNIIDALKYPENYNLTVLKKK